MNDSGDCGFYDDDIIQSLIDIMERIGNRSILNTNTDLVQ
jgi:hypothetical protein